MFRYNYVRDLLERLVRTNNFPLQVELHPSFHCGSFRCVYCYGKQQALCDGLISIKDYSQLLDDLIDCRPFIEISGIASDPLSYPDICSLLQTVIEKGFDFGVHTKGHFLNPTIISMLNDKSGRGKYITIGIDAADASTYNKLHGLPSSSMAFHRIKENVVRLFAEKVKKRSSLKINLAYLLFRSNSSREQIDEFIAAFGAYADMMRFSVPQVPNVADPIDFLDEGGIAQTFDLLKEYEDDSIAVLNFKESEHYEKFRNCWAQRFNATIDKAGNVFPCPQVALKDYLNLSYGNITRLRFWDIWDSEIRKAMLRMPVQQMGCRVCDRKDETINKELDKLMNIDRFILKKVRKPQTLLKTKISKR